MERSLSRNIMETLHNKSHLLRSATSPVSRRTKNKRFLTSTYQVTGQLIQTLVMRPMKTAGLWSLIAQQFFKLAPLLLLIYQSKTIRVDQTMWKKETRGL